jgi:hypothetical protein
MALTDLGALDMVLYDHGGCPHAFSQNVVHFIQDMTFVMQSVGPYDDLTHSDISSHTSWTLDDGQMKSHFVDMVILVERWERIPHLGESTQDIIRHLMEDIAMGHDWTPFKEVMHLHSTLDGDLFTLDVEHME